jgi:hypothetical protein
MTTAASPPGAGPQSIEFEVATSSSDPLRAGIRVSGPLGERTVPLVLSVLATHVRAGRRYLRIDLTHAGVADLAALAPLRTAHSALTELGGMLVFDNAGDDVTRALHDVELFVSTPL